MAVDPVPRSAVPGVVWPAMPDAAGALALALQDQLAQSQWWPPALLREWQFRQLAGLVRHAVGTVPYYRGNLPRDLLDNSGAVQPEAWAQVPVLARETVQAAATALNSGFVPREHGAVSVVKTSGSTGRPVEVSSTALMGIIRNGFTLRDHFWHGRDFAGKLAAIRHLHGHDDERPDGAQAQGWGVATDLAFRTGPSAAISIHADVEKQIAWLLREDPDYLIAYPSSLVALSERFASRGLRLPRLREIRSVGEVLLPDVREACQRTWGVPVTDMYIVQECGYLALQCPEHEHYHVQAEGVLLEVLDDRGRACEPGETGRVVVTPLQGFATVLLRYEVGDYAEVGEPCPCGRGLPVLRRILGRYRNLVALPDGRTWWPTFGQATVRSVAPVRQMQVVQRSLEQLEFRYVADRDLTEGEQAALSRIFALNLMHEFQIAFTRLPAIPRGPSGKFEDFLNELPRAGSSMRREYQGESR
jgi:phenylacetate-CoA ligase